MSDPRIIFVGGLHEDVNEQTIMGAFSIFGEILSVDIPTDPQTLKHKGFAVVEFLEPADAKEAIFNMDGSEMFGRTLRVKVSTRRASVQLQDPKKAAWADEIYFRKLATKPVND